MNAKITYNRTLHLLRLAKRDPKQYRRCVDRVFALMTFHKFSVNAALKTWKSLA